MAELKKPQSSGQNSAASDQMPAAQPEVSPQGQAQSKTPPEQSPQPMSQQAPQSATSRQSPQQTPQPLVVQQPSPQEGPQSDSPPAVPQVVIMDDGKKTSIFAVLAILCFLFMPPLGIIFGIFGLVKTLKDPSQKGKGLSIAAIILSLLMLWFYISFFTTGHLPFFRPKVYNCDIGLEFPCNLQKYTVRSNVNGTISAEMLNSAGKDIYLAGAKVTSGQFCNASVICLDTARDNVCDDYDPRIDTGSALVKDGSEELFVVDCEDGDQIASGKQVKFTIGIDYYPSGKKSEKQTYSADYSAEVE